MLNQDIKMAGHGRRCEEGGVCVEQGWMRNSENRRAQSKRGFLQRKKDGRKHLIMKILHFNVYLHFKNVLKL